MSTKQCDKFLPSILTNVYQSINSCLPFRQMVTKQSDKCLSLTNVYQICIQMLTKQFDKCLPAAWQILTKQSAKYLLSSLPNIY